MVTPENRSTFTVCVPRKPALTRRFAFSRLDAAQAYLAGLLAQRLPDRPMEPVRDRVMEPGADRLLGPA